MFYCALSIARKETFALCFIARKETFALKMRHIRRYDDESGGKIVNVHTGTCEKLPWC
ncbi:hypothetical protein LTSEMON_0508 [Salmonella enterica subsp. enterica serovar Montevideo str. S5-403]|uniref:Uncharacterized protein n=1 Tax=Salmonella enterica subsp. enterica serovar Montevideo str. S5-403 TaxID=913242 RepID=G5PYM3_SALMO|nr:hypothetical protein LTSEMON_0508 [Salmonella enterica subsp. enterica serovar Montevideo str. S5-403]